MYPISSLSHFVRCLKTVPDPRSKKGQSHPFFTILAIVFLGLIGNITPLAEIQRWTEIHYPELKTFLRFRCLKRKEDGSSQTGDALYVQRSLLKSLQKHHQDYLVQVKENQPKVYAKLQETYEHVRHQKPDHVLPSIALSLAKLMKKGERTLKEIRERCAAKPSEPATKWGYKKILVSGLSGLAHLLAPHLEFSPILM
jgi:hypothetical protein